METPYFWVQPLITILGILISILIVVWQINKQFKNSLELQRDSKREELYLNIYKEFAEKIETSVYSISESFTSLLSLPSKFETKISIRSFIEEKQKEQQNKINEVLKAFKIDPIQLTPPESTPIDERADNILNRHDIAQRNVIDLISKLEAYEIAIPNFQNIKKGIMNQLGLYRKTFSDFYHAVVSYLPMDVPDEQVSKVGKSVISPSYPKEDKIENFRELAYSYMDECIILSAFVTDLRVALQNHLLSNLFGRKVPLRKPRDPNLKVLDIDEE